MKRITFFVALTAMLLGIAGLIRAQQQKGGGDITGPYDLVAGWPQNWCGNGFQIGSTAGIWAESPDRVMIFARGCLPALKDIGEPVPTRNASGFSLTSPPERQPRWDHIVTFVDRNGKLIESWEQHNKLFGRIAFSSTHTIPSGTIGLSTTARMPSTSSRATASNWSRPSARQ